MPLSNLLKLEISFCVSPLSNSPPPSLSLFSLSLFVSLSSLSLCLSSLSLFVSVSSLSLCLSNLSVSLSLFVSLFAPSPSLLSLFLFAPPLSLCFSLSSLSLSWLRLSNSLFYLQSFTSTTKVGAFFHTLSLSRKSRVITVRAVWLSLMQRPSDRADLVGSPPPPGAQCRFRTLDLYFLGPALYRLSYLAAQSLRICNRKFANKDVNLMNGSEVETFSDFILENVFKAIQKGRLYKRNKSSFFSCIFRPIYFVLL